jgi:hypothetical protein
MLARLLLKCTFVSICGGPGNGRCEASIHYTRDEPLIVWANFTVEPREVPGATARRR